MSNISFRILQLMFFCAAIMYGAFTAWPSLFPEKSIDPKGNKSWYLIASIKKTRLTQHYPAGDITWKIWGQKKDQRVAKQTEGAGSSGWSISLEKEGWQLRKGNTEQWLFSGIIKLKLENVAVFYNKEAKEKWRMVKKGAFFDTLQLSTVTHEKIHLSDSEGKEWILGLFNLKTKNTDL